MTMTKMKTLRARRVQMWLAALGWLHGLPALLAADFTVTTPGSQFAFNINGVNNPTLTLVRGRTYTFAVNTTCGFHPFEILAPGVVTNNNICSGTLSYTVAPDAPATNNLGYVCSIHFFGGTILAVDPPPPPPPPEIRIVSLSVSTNLVLRSTGTNTWSVLPEFRTNLVATNWFALTVQTNTFANGTNETICGRPAADNVFIRIRSQPN
jgi:hypothetical protein